MRAGGTLFTRTLCPCCGARGSCSQQSDRVQCASSGRGPQDQWWHLQPQRLRNPHGPGIFFLHMDSPTPQSVPAMPGFTNLFILFGLSLNTYVGTALLHSLIANCILVIVTASTRKTRQWSPVSHEYLFTWETKKGEFIGLCSKADSGHISVSMLLSENEYKEKVCVFGT